MTETKIAQLTNYSEHDRRLKPWAIVRADANMQRVIVARSRKRSDAEDYARALERLQPAIFSVIYDYKP